MWPGGVNGVVPIAVKAMAFQADGGQLRVGHSDAGWVTAAVEFGADVQTSAAMGGADQADDGGEVHERRPFG